MADPTDLFAFDEIARILKRDIDLAVVTEGQLLETIDRVYRRTDEISGLAREVSRRLGRKLYRFRRADRYSRLGRSAGGQAAANHVR